MSSPSPFPKLDAPALEAKWQTHWEREGVFHWDPAAPRAESYVIDTPPPTVSGHLHIGHVFSYTQTDLLARFQRMAGKNVFYPLGFDDNGLPSERLVEKRKEVRAVDMSREDFTRLCYEVVEEAEKEFRALFRSIALSVDWRQEYRTISAEARKISQMSLLDLHAKGHLFRAPQPTLWDPVDRTAIAQAEIVEKEQSSTMYHLPFEIEGGERVTIATTRPELLPACVALMCHPEDPRTAGLLGKKAFTPLLETEVRIVADEQVDREKGTGLVMCCTFGDQTDVEWWRTYKLPLRSIVLRDGTLGNLERIGEGDWQTRDLAGARRVGAALNGVYVRKARTRMVELLREAGLILREEAITHAVPAAERSGSPLEILVTEQWMVRLLDKKELLVDKAREMTWHPPYMRQRFEDWVNNLKWDWCISRQRYFGVPVPFWYSKRAGEEGKILVPEVDDLPVNPLVDVPHGYTREEVEPDPDVLDTWATSSVSPQINSRAINEQFAVDWERHRHLFPADLRPQAHEIIRTWAFYTVAKAALHEGTVPFHHLAISGWCLAPDQSKMSKSKGNIVVPTQLIERFGVDAVRYWTATARLGRDSAYSEDTLKVGKRLVTKLWNACALAAGHIAGFKPAAATAAEAVRTGEIHSPWDRWILTSLYEAVERATKQFEAYDYTEALAAVERFFWQDYCDNYLELIKGRLYGEVASGVEAKPSAQATLYFSQRAILALFAPYLPYVTEETFSLLYPDEFAAQKSVHARGAWPKLETLPHDLKCKDLGDLGIDLFTAIRKFKSHHQVSMRAPIHQVTVYLEGPEADATWARLASSLPDLLFASNCVEAPVLGVGPAPEGAFAGDRERCRITAALVPQAPAA